MRAPWWFESLSIYHMTFPSLSLLPLPNEGFFQTLHKLVCSRSLQWRICVYVVPIKLYFVKALCVFDGLIPHILVSTNCYKWGSAFCSSELKMITSRWTNRTTSRQNHGQELSMNISVTGIFTQTTALSPPCVLHANYWLFDPKWL